MEGVKVQLQQLRTGEVCKRRLAKLGKKKEIKNIKRTSPKPARYSISTDCLGKDQNSKDSSKNYMLNFTINTSDSNV